MNKSRWRHLFLTTPLGVVVGGIVGLAFQDVLYGLLAGCSLGASLGLLMVVRNPQ